MNLPDYKCAECDEEMATCDCEKCSTHEWRYCPFCGCILDDITEHKEASAHKASADV